MNTKSTPAGFTSPWAWYASSNGGRLKIEIGPAGYDCKEYTELEFVASPAVWYNNERLMNAEMICVSRRHCLGLTDSTRAVETNCQVPGVPFNHRIGGGK